MPCLVVPSARRGHHTTRHPDRCRREYRGGNIIEPLLAEPALQWVDQTLDALSVDELIGQVMCVYLDSPTACEWWTDLSELGLKPGATMFVSRTSGQAQQDSDYLRQVSDVPMLVAGNLEAGLHNFITDARALAVPMQVAATGRRRQFAEQLAGDLALQARSLGINWAFGPVVDLAVNPRNPITGTRSASGDPVIVTEVAGAIVETLESVGIASCVKHFPGDGFDNRDQHLSTTTNPLGWAESDGLFGQTYTSMIRRGARSIMAGHIRLPHVAAEFGANETEAALPASLSRWLLRDLLRDRLGFDGLISTDSTSMAGFTSVMPRAQALPAALNAGCDLILGNIDVAEDFGHLRTAVRTGVLTEERLRDAARRVLSLKASLGLHDGSAQSSIARPRAGWLRELADESVTLIKGDRADAALDRERDRRILLYVLGDEPSSMEPSAGLAERFAAELGARGAEVTLQRIPGPFRSIAAERIHQLEYDVCVYFANTKLPESSNNLGPVWSHFKGADAPRHAEVRYVLVSVSDPFLLPELPSVQIAVNGYTPTVEVVDACVAKLYGESQFKGVSPVTAAPM